MEESNRSSAQKPTVTASKPSPSEPKPTRPLYSSKLGDAKGSPTTRTPPLAQKAWTSAKNPSTGRSPQTPQQNSFNSPASSKQTSLREGQRVRITLHTGAEFDGIYANIPGDTSNSNYHLKMVTQRRGPGDGANGTAKRDQPSMTFSRKDVNDVRPLGGKADGKAQNGNRGSFRTDTAISSSRQGGDRELKRWVADDAAETDGSLENSVGKPWDQFAANETLFGLKTDYDENIYTTAIDKAHPQYKERMAAAERKAREIERTAPTTSHVAEERVMDFVGGDDKGADEEEKYSGVRRQDFPPLQTRENKYTPPARRAPTSQATAYGAPVDPAIISSQLKGPQAKKQAGQKADDAKSPLPSPNLPLAPKATGAKGSDNKTEASAKATSTEPEKAKSAAGETTSAEQPGAASAVAALRPSAVVPAGSAVAQQLKTGAAVGTPNVEQLVLKQFKSFAQGQRTQVKKVIGAKARADQIDKLQELRKFADSFKLSTPVPTDLISIIAKDPAKQKEIQEKAIQNAEELAKSRAVVKEKETAPTSKEQSKAPTDKPASTPSVAIANANAEPRSTNRQGPHNPQSANQNQRHQGPRQSQYNNNGQFRNDRSSGPYTGPSHRQGPPPLSDRLKGADQNRHRPVHSMQPQQQQPPPPQQPQPQMLQQQLPQAHMSGPDHRLPPTGPANNMDAAYNNRRFGTMPPTHHAKLNPNSHEFRPNPSASTFNPYGPGPSNGSSPRPSVVVEAQGSSTPVTGQLIRRKTKSLDVKKCFILSHIKTFQPSEKRNWDENAGLRPSYDTNPTWRQALDDEKADSTMRMTYAEYFEKMPHPDGAMATPNPPHAMPHQIAAHQHQLPFHLQQGAPHTHSLAPRQSPHMQQMHMPGAGQPHGHVPHVSFSSADENRMMHSNSAQSYASPRMQVGQVAAAIGYPPTMNSPAQMQYQQPVMAPQFLPGTPQMNNFRSFSQNPQYMPQQQNSPMAVPMMQAGFLPAPNAGMMAGGQQMPMYAGSHQPFVAPGGAAPQQPIPGATGGYPSPGRPAAAMMAQQNSQQGQMYGHSPSMQFQQPVYQAQHPGQMNMRAYNGAGPQQYGTSPQQMHQFGPHQHRNGGNAYGGAKNFQGQHQVSQQSHSIPAGPQGRQLEGHEEGK